jgi:A/G-specific adenine glycosylase
LREQNAQISQSLLAWYDAHARELPWRVPPLRSKLGERADPYFVWLSEIMLQQTGVVVVTGYFLAFTRRWPTVTALAAAKGADVMAAWAGLGYYARARNLLKCARIVAGDLGGKFPEDRAALEALPGIGPYTSAAIAAIAFGKSETVVDGNIERVMARLHMVEIPLPKAKPELVLLAGQATPTLRAGDHAQALMDLGATICTPRKPSCTHCPLQANCLANAAGIAAELPRRTPKKPKPTRYGTVYIAHRADGAVLLERRPDKGLLRGMLGWPSSDWGDAPEPKPPFLANWLQVSGEVRHTFTHFHLILKVEVTDAAQDAQTSTGEFYLKSEFNPDDLPTLMRKAYDLASQPHGKI